MPLGNVTQMTDAERALLARWAAAALPANPASHVETLGFTRHEEPLAARHRVIPA